MTSIQIHSTQYPNKLKHAVGWFRWFLRILFLQPYGKSLRTPNFVFFISVALLAMSIMAMVEGITWGLFFAARAETPLGQALNFTFGCFIATAITWIADATLMTLDRSVALHDRIYAGISEQPDKKTLIEAGKLVTALGTRIGILAVTLFVATSMLEERMFPKEIASMMGRINAEALDSAKTAALAAVSSKLDSVEAHQTLLHTQRTTEASGKGPSGQRGAGPAVASIDRELGFLATQQQTLEVKRTAIENDFLGLRPDTLALKYGVALLPNDERGRLVALRRLRHDPDFVWRVNAVPSIIVSLFFLLILMKVLEPRALRIYYSQALQEMYVAYLSGTYDLMIPRPQEQSTARDGGMTPSRFEEWVLSTYPAIRAIDQMNVLNAQAATVADPLIQAMRDRLVDKNHELQIVQQALRDAQYERSSAEAELTRHRRERTRLELSLQQAEADTAMLDTQLANGTPSALRPSVALKLVTDSAIRVEKAREAVQITHDAEDELTRKLASIAEMLRQFEEIEAETRRLVLELKTEVAGAERARDRQLASMIRETLRSFGPLDPQTA